MRDYGQIQRGGKLDVPKRLLAVFIMAAPVFGQLKSNTLAITAARSIIAQPDQVVFGITITSPLNATLDQVVAALSPLTVTSADLTGVGNSTSQVLQWTFTYAAPLTNLSATIASISAVQQRMSVRNMLSLSFTVIGTQVSQQLQQAQTCSNADLISDATAQAQTIAAAANLTLGPILKLSNVPTESIYPAYLSLVSGAFSAVLYAPASQPITCSLLVQFQLLATSQSAVRKP